MLTFVDCKLLRVITSGVSRLIAAVISKKKRERTKKNAHTHTRVQNEQERERKGMRKEIDSNCRRPLTYTACSAMDAYKFGSFSRNQSLTLPTND